MPQKLVFSTVVEVTPATSMPMTIEHGLKAPSNGLYIPDQISLTPLDSTDVRFYLNGSGVDDDTLSLGWDTVPSDTKAKVKIDVLRWHSIAADTRAVFAVLDSLFGAQGAGQANGFSVDGGLITGCSAADGSSGAFSAAAGERPAVLADASLGNVAVFSGGQQLVGNTALNAGVSEGSDLTVSLWLQADAGAAGTLLSYGTDLQVTLAAGLLTMRSGAASQSVAITADEWHTIAFCFDRASGTVSLYVDGVLVGTYTSGALDFTGQTWFWGLGFSGQMAQLRIEECHKEASEVAVANDAFRNLLPDLDALLGAQGTGQPNGFVIEGGSITGCTASGTTAALTAAEGERPAPETDPKLGAVASFTGGYRLVEGVYEQYGQRLIGNSDLNGGFGSDKGMNLTIWFKPDSRCGSDQLQNYLLTYLSNRWLPPDGIGATEANIYIQGAEDGFRTLAAFMGDTAEQKFNVITDPAVFGTWHHLEASFDSETETVSCYLDGVLLQGYGLPPGAWPIGKFTAQGARWEIGWAYYGLIAQVHIASGTRTAEQVAADYAAFQALLA
jgi:hypothetical protein